MTDTYGYDAGGHLASLASSQAGQFRFAYDGAGQRTRPEHPNGVTTTYAHNPAGSVSDIVHARGSAVLDVSRYGYDGSGRRTSVTQHDGVHGFSYDDVGRVTGADHPGAMPDESFAYDERGNLTGGGAVYDASNRLLGRDGWRYEYDDQGRMTKRIRTQSGEETRFSWRADGRLGSVTSPDGSVTSYRYDPLGRRVAVMGAGSQTRVGVFGLDPNVVAEVSGDVVSRLTFDLGYDRPLAQRSGSATLFFGQDALSSVTSVFDSAGQVTGRAGYTTYGQLASQTGTASRYTYTGREWDAESGTYYYRDRQYDPATARFLTEDPVPAANLYWYADANPIELNDPTGRMSMSEINAASVTYQGLLGAGYGGVSQMLRCGSDFEDVAIATIKGGVIGAGSGFVVKRLFRYLGGYAGNTVSEVVNSAKGSLLLANAVGGGLSVAASDLTSGDFDPFATLVAMVTAGVAAPGEVGTSGSCAARAAGVVGVVTAAVEISRAVPGGPERC